MATEHGPASIDRQRLRSQRLRQVNFPIALVEEAT
jgi:hypothetical protein